MSKNIFINIGLFAVGAAVGSVATWKIVKTKYENEIITLVDQFNECLEEDLDDCDDIDEDDIEEENNEAEIKKAEVVSYNDITSSYISNSDRKNIDDVKKEIDGIIEKETSRIIDKCNNIVNNERIDDYMNKDAPYLIPPEELGEEGYEVITLIHYSDGNIVEYGSTDVVDDLKGAIGDINVNDHFGDHVGDPDSVYVRNDARGVDYEILRDEDPWFGQ